VQLLAVFGATLGPGPHIMVGNKRHRAVINPLIVGRTNNGAKGTSLDAVEAVRKVQLDWFDEFTTSGLSSAEGLIELVRDPSGDPGDDNYDPGVDDKRLLVKESEYRSVLARCRREGNTLGMTLRQAFDGENLRTLTRKHNKLTTTDPHIVVIGHITPPGVLQGRRGQRPVWRQHQPAADLPIAPIPAAHPHGQHPRRGADRGRRAVQ
jgi:hypothetical protein